MRRSGAIFTAVLVLATLVAVGPGSIAPRCGRTVEAAGEMPACSTGDAAERSPRCCAGHASESPHDCCFWSPAGDAGGGPAAVAPSASALGAVPPPAVASTTTPPQPARRLRAGGPPFSPRGRLSTLHAVLLI